MIPTKPDHTRSLPKSRRAFQNAIVRWFSENGRDYPWRRTRDPYEVLVSEMMLQQTQVATVLGKKYFESWLEKFPDLISLAKASESDVLKAWEGLGYYRRARNLQKAAKTIVDSHSGEFPESLAQIRALPGVGKYSAGAVMTFAFGESTAIVDANIARVLSRLFDYQEPIDSTKGSAQLWQWAESLLPKKSTARSYNSGLMELGQRICSTRSPQCSECPVAEFCKTRLPSGLPLKKPRAEITRQEETVAFCRDTKLDRVLLQQETGKRREGLWKLPVAPNQHRGPILLKVNYSITRYRVAMTVCGCPPEAFSPGDTTRWFHRSELSDIAMPSPYRKALITLLENETFALTP